MHCKGLCPCSLCLAEANELKQHVLDIRDLETAQQKQTVDCGSVVRPHAQSFTFCRPLNGCGCESANMCVRTPLTPTSHASLAERRGSTSCVLLHGKHFVTEVVSSANTNDETLTTTHQVDNETVWLPCHMNVVSTAR